MARRIMKRVRLERANGGRRPVVLDAVIDTGTGPTVIPPLIAWRLDLEATGEDGSLTIAGKKREGAFVRVRVAVLGTSKCDAVVEGFVPEEWEFGFAIVGSLFLQQTGAVIRYDRAQKGRGGTPTHPVLCGRTVKVFPVPPAANPREDVSFGVYDPIVRRRSRPRPR